MAADLAAELCRNVSSPHRQVSGATLAELARLLENFLRCVNIALVNELQRFCLRMGIDIWEVIDEP
jgi:UDP-N-acetyl-D-mannosaminuronate dehydrogenase